MRGAHRLRWTAVAIAALALAGPAFAQSWWDRPIEPGERNGVPSWDLDPDHPEDAFSFARIKYSSYRRRG